MSASEAKSIDTIEVDPLCAAVDAVINNTEVAADDQVIVSAKAMQALMAAIEEEHQRESTPGIERCTQEASVAPNLGPPWVLYIQEGKPHSILPAMRVGEVARVDHLTMKEAEAIVRGANGLYNLMAHAKLKNLEAGIAAMTAMVTDALRREPDAPRADNPTGGGASIEAYGEKVNVIHTGDLNALERMLEKARAHAVDYPRRSFRAGANAARTEALRMISEESWPQEAQRALRAIARRCDDLEPDPCTANTKTDP